jgi:phenylacetate-CoA ligase
MRRVVRRWKRGVDALLRAMAFELLCRRDRLRGWRHGRAELFGDVKADRIALQQEGEAKLRRIMAHAYEMSPHYRQAWDAVGYAPSAGPASDDLLRVPFLTKDILKRRKDLLRSREFRIDELDVSYTGGTTGTQTSFYRDHACTVRRTGRHIAILELCGYSPWDRRGLLWGVPSELQPTGVGSALKWRFRKFASSQESLPCLVMSDESMLDFHGRLRKFRPTVLYGYPSAMTEFARFVERSGLDPVPVGTAICTAERLSDSQREYLERIFNAEVFNLYCTREYGCVGFECSRHDGLHVDIGSVFVEIIRDGRRAALGELGEVTITDLLNRGMPMIRNRTGDLAALELEPCECGCPFPRLTRLDGRVTDVLYKPDGSIVAGVMLVDLFTDLPAIEQAQFVQESERQLAIRVVAPGGLSPEAEAEALAQAREVMGEHTVIRIERVRDLARNTNSGKVQEVICKIERPAGPAPA